MILIAQAQSDPNIPIYTALITAGTTLVCLIIKDIVYKLWERRKNKAEARLEVYRLYADPLAQFATSLLWRFSEIFDQPGRGTFLTAKPPRTDFEDYKFTSTKYRLASLLGWIRALRRELSFLRLEKSEINKAFEEAISVFESALADGPHVEKERLDAILDLWKIKGSSAGIKTEASVSLEHILKRKLKESEVSVASDLSDEKQLELVEASAELLCEKFNWQAISEDVIKETKAQTIRFLSVKESWIYRDWQSALGDIMIESVDFADRHYGVIGYSQFEKMLFEGSENEKRWLERLGNVFNDLDVTIQHQFDARLRQLRNTYLATSKLLAHISKVDGSFVSEETLKICNELKEKEANKTLHLTSLSRRE